ncbi:unnamed protein product [Kuraishia capsulata CBS 1993]|uniref:Exocyst complex component Sec8 n=1 Tax=Kuraishia capsulata CBS 1993 TaxID=1382522 RepID=W6MUC7_9ASCO|nr:uncharacterized protein KUCA_T00001510001 [Kuraishia capsulata CBS 1993]CDK25540.1 unnamed protein product [Kuraishia capsulata CBS 1993]
MNLAVGGKTTRARGYSINHATSDQDDRMARSLDQLGTVLHLVEREWSDVMRPSANPLEAALPLLDDTSVGMAHRYPEFKHLKEKLSKTLRAAVNEHYQAFNDSVGSYGITVETVADSQRIVHGIRKSLQDVSDHISAPRSMLDDLNNNSAQYGEMVEIVDAIIELKSIPDAIDELIAEKRFQAAQEELTRASKVADTHGLWRLSSLAGIQQYLASQSQALFEVLVEELHSVIYLKVSEDFTASSSKPKLLDSMASMDVSSRTTPLFEKFDRFMNEFQKSKHKSHEDIPKNPDFKRYSYISELLHTISALDKLPQALNALSQRMSSEIQQLLNRSTEETRLRHPQNSQSATGFKKLDPSALMLSIALGDVNVLILEDLFWNIFSRCISVLQGHRVIFETVSVLSNGPAVLLSTEFTFESAWKAIEKEISGIIYNYIIDEDITGDAMSDSDKSIWIKNDDRAKGLMFQFSKLTFKNTEAESLASNLQNVLQDMFPGYTLRNPTGKSLYIESESFTHQETLVEPNVYSMKIILPSLLVFIDSAVRCYPQSQQKTVPITFFNYFMSNIFHVQLRDILYHQFEQISTVGNPWELDAAHGASRNSVAFKSFFLNTCDSLNTSLSFRGSYVDIVFGILEKMVLRFEQAYKEVCPDESTNTRPRLSSYWMNMPELYEVSLNLITKGEDAYLLQEETSTILENVPSSISAHDILDGYTYESLTKLLGSLNFTLSWLPSMKTSVTNVNQGVADSPIDKLKDDWVFMEEQISRPADSTSGIFLTLQGESVGVFDSVVRRLEELRSRIQLTLRYDLRSKIVYYINTAYGSDSWMPDFKSHDIDSSIVALNRAVVEADSSLETILGARGKERILSGISGLIDHALVSQAKEIIKLNSNGIDRIYLNITIIQQMLRSVLPKPDDVTFTRALEYFELFKSTDKGILENARNNLYQFSFEERKTMIRLFFSEELSRGIRHQTASISATKRYSDAVNKLHDIYSGKTK